MTAQPSLSRMQVLDRPYLLPGKCVCCGTVDRPVVDLGMSLDRYGVVYFCEDCIGEAARQFGYSSPADSMGAALGAEQSFDKYLNDNDLVVIDRGLYDSITDSVRSLYDALPVRRDDLHVVDATEELGESEGTDSGVPESDDANSDAPVTSAGQKPRANRQRRPSSVPSNPSDEFDFNAGIE